MKIQSKGSSMARDSTKRDQLGASKGQKGPCGLNLGASSSSKVEPSHSGILLSSTWDTDSKGKDTKHLESSLETEKTLEDIQGTGTFQINAHSQ